MAHRQGDAKWRAAVEETIPASIDKVWDVLADFDGAHRHFPQIMSSCQTVEGVKNQVGSVRVVKWTSHTGYIVEVRERLLIIDKGVHAIWYETEHANLGLTGHKAFISLESVVDSDQTVVNWNFELDPGNIITKEGFVERQTLVIRKVLQLLRTTLSEETGGEGGREGGSDGESSTTTQV